MKNLQDFKNLVEEEKSDYKQFDMLVRAGLANKAQLARIHRIMDKMTEERPQFNNADREIMRNLFNRMTDLISNNKQIFMITDGKPSCMFTKDGFYKNSAGLDNYILDQCYNRAREAKKNNITSITQPLNLLKFELLVKLQA